MKDYSTIANTSGSFPDVVAVNASGPSATDGTPYIKQFVDDLWGAAQALMDAAFIAPNGVTEAAGASQRLEAIRRISGYPGEIIAWGGRLAIDPYSLGIRLLLLDGSGVLRSDFPELDSIVYVGDGNNGSAPAFYHADDEAGTIRNTAGNYLILADARGLFLRGVPSGGGREIGDFQDSSLQDHYHETQEGLTGNICYSENLTTGSGGVLRDIAQMTTTQSASKKVIARGISGAPVDLFETYPDNTAVRFFIRY